MFIKLRPREWLRRAAPALTNAGAGNRRIRAERGIVTSPHDEDARLIQAINDAIRSMTTGQLYDYACDQTAAEETGTALAQAKLEQIELVLRDGTEHEQNDARRDLELFCKRLMMRQRGL